MDGDSLAAVNILKALATRNYDDVYDATVDTVSELIDLLEANLFGKTGMSAEVDQASDIVLSIEENSTLFEYSDLISDDLIWKDFVFNIKIEGKDGTISQSSITFNEIKLTGFTA